MRVVVGGGERACSGGTGNELWRRDRGTLMCSVSVVGSNAGGDLGLGFKPHLQGHRSAWI